MEMDGPTFKARLDATGKTQDDLARHLGKSRPSVSRILSGDTRMLTDVSRRIEAFLAQHERIETTAPGVRESTAPFESAPRKKLSPEELEIILREIAELGAILKNAPRITDMSDDELLGYDTTP